MSNVLAAVAVGIAVGAPLEDIVRGLEEVDVVPGRVELIDEEQSYAVVVDYAHTPDALSRLLDTVRECGPQRLITGVCDRGVHVFLCSLVRLAGAIVLFSSRASSGGQTLGLAWLETAIS